MRGPTPKPKDASEELLAELERGLTAMWVDMTTSRKRRSRIDADGHLVEEPEFTIKDRLAVADRLLKLAAIKSNMAGPTWGSGFSYDDDKDDADGDKDEPSR